MTRGYSDRSLWKKIKQVGRAVGEKITENVLTLYYVAMARETPRWAKAVIFGALAYFILIIDAIPDIIPGGYLDDAGVLTTALLTVIKFITDDIKMRVLRAMRSLFG